MIKAPPQASVFYVKTFELITSALSFVLALAWRDAITNFLDHHIKGKLTANSWFKNHPMVVYFLYAIIMTVLVVCISWYFQPHSTTTTK